MFSRLMLSIAVLAAALICFCDNAAAFHFGSAFNGMTKTRTISSFSGIVQRPRNTPYPSTMMSDTDTTAETATENSEQPAKKPSLFVGNLPFTLDEGSIFQLLNDRLGEPVNFNLISDQNTGRHRGFGYIEFDDVAAANSALAKLSGLQVDGRDVRVDMATERAERQSAAPRAPQENSIFIGNLDFSVTEDQIMAMCNDLLGAGFASRVRLVTDRETGRPRGFGHIDFASPEDATKAITALTGVSMMGRDLRVDQARRKEDLPPRREFNNNSRQPRSDPSNSIFVGNLAWDVDSDLLEEMLNDVLGPGQFKTIRLATDRETGRPRGFCHVDFNDAATAERAIVELNGLEVMGRQLRVDTAQRKEGGGGGGRFGGGGGGRGGGRGGGFRNDANSGSFGAF